MESHARSKNLIVPVTAATVILALNLFFLSPQLAKHLSVGVGNGIYLLIRVAVVIGLSFFLVRSYGRNRVQAISVTGFVMFIEHVVFKLIIMSVEAKADPAAWEGFQLSSAVIGMMISYILFFPIIMILGFLGVELNNVVARRSNKT